MARRIISARQQAEMLAPWRKTADRVDLRWERDGGGDWILVTRNPDGNPVAVPFKNAPSLRTSSVFDPMAVTQRLSNEFHDWFHSLPDDRLHELKNIELHPFMDRHQDNPVGHWPTVERFLKDKYPAAHRGFLTGREDASMWLDDPDNEYESPMLEGDDEFGGLPPPEPYSSADHQKLGYDPQEVVAGMVLLHNRAHSGRQDSYLSTDKARLVDIYNKRQQMQRNYEQRQAAWYHTSPRRLPVGTDLLPGGGGHHDRFYRAIGDPGRADHVWVEDDPRLLKRWHDIDSENNYHYRVEPDEEPVPYRGDASQGYVVPRARVVEELGLAKRKKGR